MSTGIYNLWQSGDSAAAAPETCRANGAAVAAVLHAVCSNACYSTAQAEAFGAKIDCVVGMDGAIGDDAARAFAIRVYGTPRQRTVNAVAQSVATLAAKQLPDEVLPRCVTRDGVDPDEVTIGAQPSS